MTIYDEVEISDFICNAIAFSSVDLRRRLLLPVGVFLGG
jgi:hypothetical protein